MVVRARAFLLLLFTLAASVGAIWFLSHDARWLKAICWVFFLPFVFVIEILTGAPILHSNLVFQSFPAWKRALIVFAVLLFGVAELTAGLALYVALHGRF